VNAPAAPQEALLREAAFIDGEWITGDRQIEVINPATGAVVGRIPNLGCAATKGAVAAAVRALPDWQAFSVKARCGILRDWHALIVQNRNQLARLLTLEQGKPFAEASAEIDSTAAYLEWYAEEGRRAYGAIIPANQAGRRLLLMRSPVGVVAAITPWNFPSSMIARKVAPALAAGCTMVLKPSELTPFSALALAALGAEAGVPKGVFNVVTGSPGPIGDVLVEDIRVAKFSFTGSTAVGKQLASRCMSSVKRVSLELGGNAPFVVFDDSDIEAAVAGAMVAKFRNSGQTCICANRILVHSNVHDEFARLLAARVAQLRVGNGLADNVQQGPLINEAAVAKVDRHLTDARNRGAAVIATADVPAAGKGTFFRPTVITNVDRRSLLCREETFGPLAPLLKFEREDEAVQLANEGRVGLAAYVYTRDAARAWRMTAALQYGMVGVNSAFITTEVAPFGGMRESGLGREGGHEGLEEYLERKLMVMDVPAISRAG
jgi:succinate-semialdehyde dehydrogenase/glutarate-semialdehyde dehydrogenase